MGFCDKDLAECEITASKLFGAGVIQNKNNKNSKYIGGQVNFEAKKKLAMEFRNESSIQSSTGENEIKRSRNIVVLFHIDKNFIQECNKVTRNFHRF
jgi:hypothetical protein